MIPRGGSGVENAAAQTPAVPVAHPEPIRCNVSRGFAPLGELLGVLAILAGLGLVVGSAALVSTALAWAAAGVVLIGIGSTAIYVAAVLDTRPASAGEGVC